MGSVLAQAPRPLDRVHQLAPRLGAALDLKPQHGAVHAVQVLPVGELLLRERGEAGVLHDVHLGVALEELGDLLRGLRLPLDAKTEGLGGLRRIGGGLRLVVGVGLGVGLGLGLGLGLGRG